MISVIVDGINICEKYKVTLESFEIGMPEPKLVKVHIPGRDGELDMSEALSGYVNYGNREINLSIGITGDDKVSESKKQQVLVAVLGKRIKLQLSHLDGYFLGRCVSSSISREMAHHTLNLSFSCDPYRYFMSETVQTITLSNTAKDITFSNATMPVSPVLETSADATVKFKEKTYNLKKGTHRLGFVFMPGNNVLNVLGTGTLKVRYRKGVM